MLLHILLRKSWYSIWVKGTFLSEDTDVFVISGTRRTFIYLPEVWILVTEHCLEIEDVLKFENLETCRDKMAALGWLGQPYKNKNSNFWAWVSKMFVCFEIRMTKYQYLLTKTYLKSA